ncbi:MAG: 4-hydroxythreonine-4-phosphate dehydrogenase PdxA [Bacteroidaceae bacterium]|nr:4-hydroxythreonine-4-phosphate dehydrogenase PdxA [Bacteroidaceae bacterium]
MEQKRIRVGITQGDTNGVGYEVILKAFTDPTMLELCTPIVYGNPRIATYHRKGLSLSTNFASVQNAGEAQDDRLNLVVVDDTEVKIEMGQPSAEAGQQALKSLEQALADYRQGLIDVLVTAPINKHSIQSDKFHFPGHTEYIQNRVGDGQQALMILMNERLRVALVTTHLPIRKVADAITAENIVGKLEILNRTLLRDFAISGPRIAVLALNPHAGENGLLGNEEQETIVPAIEQANQQGINAYGPYAADGFFGTRAYEHYDAVLAMYHDQGLTAFKALAMDDGVNYTAGLPIVRTSPAHGTAYDIAGQGVANENSFRQAIYAAIDVLRNRRTFDEAGKNPLPKLYHDRREDDRRPPRRPEQ